MWLFVDESWSPDEHRPRIGVLCGVLFKTELIDDLDSLLYGVRKKYYGREHAKNLMYELKGKDLLSNAILRRHNSGDDVMRNINIVRELLSYPIREELHFRCLASTVYRQDDLKPTLLPDDHRRLAEPFAQLVRSASEAAAEQKRTITMVFDQRLGAQKHVAIAVRNFVRGLAVSNVHPYPYFAVSNASPAIQIADVFATVVMKRALQRQQRHPIVEQLYRHVRSLQWQSADGTRFGLWRYNETGGVDGVPLTYRRRLTW